MLIRLFTVPVLAVMALVGCSREPDVSQFKLEVNSPENLFEHTNEFHKEVVKVTDGVYVAVGFGLANSIMIEGDDGLIIVDAMETAEEAAAVKAEFDKISQKPIKAIIFTHNHADHVFGAGIFVGDNNPDIYAHETFNPALDRVVNVVRPIIATRSARMFGSHLEDSGLVNAGIGPHLGMHDHSNLAIVRPTITFSDTLKTEIAGVKIELVHAPGESPDQLFVWLPEKKVLIPADNVYKSFPNLYSIRGTSYRDVLDWVASLDKMRTKHAEYLIPCHSRPVSGVDKVQQLLTDYRDAIQYVHDQTVRGINQGLTPDELVEFVRLPPHLAQSPYLQEFYGMVAWSVRSIFNGYLGWFDGNPTTLLPLAPNERAQRFVALAGGESALLAQAETAVGTGDYQWALELTDPLLRLNPDSQRAKAARVEALLALGESQSNANARHYYLTQALELNTGFNPGIKVKPNEEYVRSLPLDVIFKSMAVNVDPSETIDMNKKVNFNFTDTGEAYSIHVRHGVAEVQPRLLTKPDITVTIDSILWKEVVAGLRNPVVAFAKGDISVEGGAVSLARFLSLFKAG